MSYFIFFLYLDSPHPRSARTWGEFSLKHDNKLFPLLSSQEDHQRAICLEEQFVQQ